MGNQVVFVCQETRSTLRWVVDLPGGSSNDLTVEVSSSQAGRLPPPANNPLGFEFYVLSSSTASSVISELRVTAVRGVNGAIVECRGQSMYPSSTIQISSVGESVQSYMMITWFEVVLTFSCS